MQPRSGAAPPTLTKILIQAVNEGFLAQQHPRVSYIVLFTHRVRAAVRALQMFVRSDAQSEAETRLFHYCHLLEIEMASCPPYAGRSYLLN